MWINMKIEILNALPENAKDIKNINSKTWFQTYKNDLYWINLETINKFPDTKEAINKFIDKKYNEILNNPWSYIVAKVNNEVIWYACWKIHLAKKFNELFSIYILPEYQNNWLWQKLINKVFDYLWVSKPIIVQVIEYNKKAINFYEKNGFKFNEKLSDIEIITWIFVPEIQMIKVF